MKRNHCGACYEAGARSHRDTDIEVPVDTRQARCAAGIRSARILCAAAFSGYFFIHASAPAAATGESPPAPSEVLDTITVKSERLSVETLIDRKSYSVASDAQSAFGSLSDILSNIPSIDVDATGIVSLRGDSKVLILIDGKPSSQFAGASAGDNLQSIPASDIERIEVITTPPAEFKADGAAGVINIITRKGHRSGTAGSLQASAGSGGRYVLGADGTYGHGPLTAALSAGYRQDYRERRVQSTVSAPDPTAALVMDSSNVISERIRREIPTVKFSGEYAFSDQQSLSGSASWAERGGLRTYTQMTASSIPDVTIGNVARRLSSGHDPETDYDSRLAFAQKLKNSGETLNFSVHRTVSQQHERYDYINEPLVPPSATFYDNLSFHEDNESTEFTTDYALPLAKTRFLKLGYALQQDDYHFSNVGNNVDPLSGLQEIDPNLTNQFKFRQRIHALYASYQLSLGSWTWLAGLRAEETDTVAQQITHGMSMTSRYFQLYPSLHADDSLSDKSTLTFGASRRVNRPDPSYLNPYVDHEYTPNLNVGNPGLQPQYSQSYETGYGYEGGRRSYSATAYYRLNRDTVTDVTQYLADGVSLTSKANLPRDRAAGLEFSANGRPIEKLAYGISGNLFYSQIDATALGIPGLQSTVGLNAKAKLDYRFTDDTSAQLTVTRTDKRLTPQGHIDAINIVNLGYKYQLMPNLSGVLTVTDLFNGQKLHRFSTSPAFAQDYRRFVLGRILYVGVVYSFGPSARHNQPPFQFDP